MKTPKCLLVILCLNVLPNKSEIADICSAPLIELTQESCNNGLGFDKFQIEYSKKNNWKKPLNGKIRFKFSGNSGKHKEAFCTLVESLVQMTCSHFTNFLNELASVRTPFFNVYRN